MDRWQIIFCIVAFPVCGLGGYVALLRSNAPLNWRSKLSAFLTSALVGSAIASLMIERYSPGLTFFCCVVSGLSGSTGLEMITHIAMGLIKLRVGNGGNTRIEVPDDRTPPPEDS